MKRYYTKSEIAACAAVAKANPNWSLRTIYRHLNLEPINDASMYRKGTAVRAAAEADYIAEHAAWRQRNGKA